MDCRRDKCKLRCCYLVKQGNEKKELCTDLYTVIPVKTSDPMRLFKEIARKGHTQFGRTAELVWAINVDTDEVIYD